MSLPPTPVVTCTIYFEDKFLVIRRHDQAKKFGGSWGFPGGKVEIGETIAGALMREVKEETNLDLTDQLLFLDSYYYGDSLGLHFAVFTTSNDVTCEPGIEHKWLSTLEELQEFPRIPGIDWHIKMFEKFSAQKSPYLSISDVNYLPEKYIN